jgi:hypothetical protein
MILLWSLDKGNEITGDVHAREQDSTNTLYYTHARQARRDRSLTLTVLAPRIGVSNKLTRHRRPSSSSSIVFVVLNNLNTPIPR